MLRAPARPKGLIPAHAGKTPSGCPWPCLRAAHPRSRGENCAPGSRPSDGQGSSPLTRGKHRSLGANDHGHGLIPAHAGKTSMDRVSSGRVRAHPRSRGENYKLTIDRGAYTGSSPLTRGKRRERKRNVLADGLIPAHAGKTDGAGANPQEEKAHPRSRGENGCCGQGSRLDLGSSPLTRGKLLSRSVDERRERLIPAHAGKTYGAPQGGSAGWAHPRSRGENIESRTVTEPCVGSSPLTRGKRKRERSSNEWSGLIPAHAGKTIAASVWSSSTLAHPRSRGENGFSSVIAAVATGSSPLTRGKRGQDRGERHARGLIPAHAGKTITKWSSRTMAGAHPRSRGENRYSWIRVRVAAGSSPLTRGKLPLAFREAVHQRLIPAHAGKTSRCGATQRRARAHPRSRGENRQRARASLCWWGSSPLTRGKQGLRLALGGNGGLIPAHAGKTATRLFSYSETRAHPRSRGENSRWREK